MKPVFLRTPFNYDMNKAGDESGLRCEGPSLTHQSFAEEVDINTLIRRFGLNGELPVGLSAPTYIDYEGVFDFHSAMNAVSKAHEAFDAMPAHVRSRFNNDPGAFVDFCSNVANRDEAVKLGLVLPKAASLASEAPDPPAKQVLPVGPGGSAPPVSAPA